MIALLLTSKDEGAVLLENLRHHLTWGVDHVAVADNESGDDTQDVLRSFGDRVTTEVFADFGARQTVRMRLLSRVQEKLRGAVTWAGVSDTDEFFWRAGAASIRDLLADVPLHVVCATFHQKLFLPCESDPVDGAVHQRQTWRTTGYASPLHTSWTEGKSFYRTSWLRSITSEHRGRDAPHAEWGPKEPAVHHYMIRDEDQFVMKVKRLTAWQPRRGWRASPIVRSARRALGLGPGRPFVADFKARWWQAYEEGGEDGLRRHFRERYRLQTADLPRLVAEGQVVRDTSFADFHASRGGR